MRGEMFGADIVKLQAGRSRKTGAEQYRVTIPKKIVRDLGLKKGQPLFILVEEGKIVLEPIRRQG